MRRGAAALRLSGAALTLCVAGCASSPALHYFTLSEVEPARPGSVAAGFVPVRLERVTIPTELDRSNLVRRLDATRLQISEDDRWAAPLEDTIRRVLAQDLAARLGTAAVEDPNEPATSEPRQSLSVDIREFYGDTRCAVSLRAAWTFKPAGAETATRRGEESVSVANGGSCEGVAALPPLMSEALARLSDRLAAAVAR